MKLSALDRNFIIDETFTEPDMEWFSVLESPFSLHGVLYDSQRRAFLRMPQETADRVSEQVALLNTNTSGGRVRFRTDSPYIAIRAVMHSEFHMSHMPLTCSSGFDLYRLLEGRETYFSTFVPPADRSRGYTSGTKTHGELTDYTVNFPLYDHVDALFVGLKRGSVLDAAAPYRHPLPMVFYGSSITQGGCASRPGNSYPAFLSRRLSADFVNLGFSGSGKGEPEIAQYVAGLPMSVFILDYDSNAPSVEALQATHYPFYKAVRSRQPELPIVIISHSAALHGVYYTTKVDPSWGAHADRRAVIEETFARALADGDRNVYCVDGRELFKGEEWDACTVDGVHPNDLGFLRMAQHLEPLLASLLTRRTD